MIKRRLIDEGIFIIKIAAGMAAFIVVAVVLSLLLSGTLLEKELAMAEMGKVLPKAMLELVGMQSLQVFPSQVEIFFLILMVSNLVMMGAVIGHSVHGMRASFEKGAFAFYYMQIMDKGVYYVFVVLCLFLANVIAWGVYVLEVMLGLAFITKGMEVVTMATVEAIYSEWALRGIGVLLLMVSIGVLYGIKQYHNWHGVDFGLCVIGISFVLGNMYKIPQFIGQKQVEEMVNAQMTMKIANYLKEIRFVCPFSWLNPFNIHHKVLVPGMIGCYVLVGILIFVVAGVVFWKRDWQEL